MISFNDSLSNDIVGFEQLGPGVVEYKYYHAAPWANVFWAHADTE